MPRRQLTEPAPDAAEDLPQLTAQQREFVRHVLEGKTASDAYRAAYSTENMQQSTIWAEASRLMNDHKVSAWLAAARKACLGSAVVTLEDHQRQLARLREIALDKGNVGAAVAAEQTRGKVAGHHIERIQDMTQHSAEDTLREIAAASPELAASLAASHGIELANITTGTKH